MTTRLGISLCIHLLNTIHFLCGISYVGVGQWHMYHLHILMSCLGHWSILVKIKIKFCKMDSSLTFLDFWRSTQWDQLEKKKIIIYKIIDHDIYLSSHTFSGLNIIKWMKLLVKFGMMCLDPCHSNAKFGDGDF